MVDKERSRTGRTYGLACVGLRNIHIKQVRVQSLSAWGSFGVLNSQSAGSCGALELCLHHSLCSLSLLPATVSLQVLGQGRLVVLMKTQWFPPGAGLKSGLTSPLRSSSQQSCS